MFNNTAQSCLARAEGNQREADYLFDCTYFEYYFRLAHFVDWAKKRDKAIKDATKTAS